MKNKKIFFGLMPILAVVALGCAGNNSSKDNAAGTASTISTTSTASSTGVAKIRLWHGIADNPAGSTFATIGLKAGNNSQTLVSNVALNALPNQYFNVPTGDAVRLIVDAPGTGTVITSDSNKLESGKRYTVVTYSPNGTAGNANMVVYSDDNSNAESGKIKVRAIFLSQKRAGAPQLGLSGGANSQPIDVWLVSRDDPNNAQTKLADGILLGGSGGYISINGTPSSNGYNASITLRNAGAAVPLNSAVGTLWASSNRANPVTTPVAGVGLNLVAGQSYTLMISDVNNVVLLLAGYAANAEGYFLVTEPGN